MKASLRKNVTESSSFPANHEEIRYPPHGLQVGMLYSSTNQDYGALTPSKMDMPTKYYPRPAKFTASFCGGQYQFNGLITSASKSRVPFQAE